jgi:hypothetical protein
LLRDLEYVGKRKLTLKPKKEKSNYTKGERRKLPVIHVRAYPTLLLVLMGTFDCITTVIGTLYFGAVELNPVIAGVVTSNIAAFVALKLATTVMVCLIFLQAEKILMKTQDKSSKAFSRTQKMLKVAYAGVIVFLVVVVANNIMVLVNAF